MAEFKRSASAKPTGPVPTLRDPKVDSFVQSRARNGIMAQPRSMLERPVAAMDHHPRGVDKGVGGERVLAGGLVAALGGAGGAAGGGSTSGDAPSAGYKAVVRRKGSPLTTELAASGVSSSGGSGGSAASATGRPGVSRDPVPAAVFHTKLGVSLVSIGPGPASSGVGKGLPRVDEVDEKSTSGSNATGVGAAGGGRVAGGAGGRSLDESVVSVQATAAAHKVAEPPRPPSSAATSSPRASSVVLGSGGGPSPRPTSPAVPGASVVSGGASTGRVSPALGSFGGLHLGGSRASASSPLQGRPLSALGGGVGGAGAGAGAGAGTATGHGAAAAVGGVSAGAGGGVGATGRVRQAPDVPGRHSPAGVEGGAGEGERIVTARPYRATAVTVSTQTTFLGEAGEKEGATVATQTLRVPWEAVRPTRTTPAHTHACPCTPPCKSTLLSEPCPVLPQSLPPPMRSGSDALACSTG
jgi:hypothetical protein